MKLIEKNLLVGELFLKMQILLQEMELPNFYLSFSMSGMKPRKKEKLLSKKSPLTLILLMETLATAWQEQNTR